MLDLAIASEAKQSNRGARDFHAGFRRRQRRARENHMLEIRD
jgi:hypothetical protein